MLEIKGEDNQDFPEFVKLIHTLSYVTHYKIEKDASFIELINDSARLPLFNTLTQNSIPIKEITQIKNSLENVYISIVKEEENHVGQ